MGTAIISYDTEFTNNFGTGIFFKSPSITNLYYLGNNENDSTKDFSGKNNTSSIQTTVIDDVTYPIIFPNSSSSINAPFIRFAGATSSVYVKSNNQIKSDNLTAIVVYRKPSILAALSSRALVSQLYAPGNETVRSGFVFGTNLFEYVTNGSGGRILNSENIEVPAGDNFYIVSYRLGNGSASCKIHEENRDIEIFTDTYSDPLVIEPTNNNYTLNIGGCQGAHGGGSSNVDNYVDIAVCAFYTGEISNDYFQNNINYIRQYCKLNDIPVA